MKRTVLLIILTNMLHAGVVWAVRAREATTRGTVTKIIFQPKSGRTVVDGGQGGQLQTSQLPVVWQISAEAVFASTTLGEPDSLCSLPLTDLPGPFQAQLENMIDTKLVPVLKAPGNCNTP